MDFKDFLHWGAQSLVLLAIACGTAIADTFPSRPVTLIVPYPPGGASDVMARAVAPLLSQQLRQPVIIDNVGGAGGALGVQKLLAAQRDGHTLLLGTPSEAVLVPLSNAAIRYRSEELRLAGVLGTAHLMLATRSDFPAHDIDSFVERSRSKAGGYNYGSIGLGSVFHFAGEALKAQAHVPLVHVPYKGVGPMVQDLLGGQLDLAFLPAAGTTLAMLDANKLKLIGPATAARDPRYPQTRTLGEGKYLKDFKFSIWSGIFVTSDTPENVLKVVHAAVTEVLRSPEFKQRVEVTGSVPSETMSLDRLSELYETETSRYRMLAKVIKLEPQ